MPRKGSKKNKQGQKEQIPLSDEPESPSREQEDQPHLESSSAKKESPKKKQPRTESIPKTAIQPPKGEDDGDDVRAAGEMSQNAGNATQKSSRRARRKANLKTLKEVTAEIKKLTLEAGETLKTQIDGDQFGLSSGDARFPPMCQQEYVDLFAKLAISTAKPTPTSTKPSTSSTKWGTSSGLSPSEYIQKLIYIASVEPSSCIGEASSETDILSAASATIIGPKLIDSSFLQIFDTWIGKMIDNKYCSTIQVIDSRTDFTEQLLGTVVKLHYSSPSSDNVSNDLVRFVQKLLDKADCSSLLELEDLLYSHRKFRIAIKKYFIIRKTIRKVEMNLKRSSTSESGPAIPKVQKFGNEQTNKESKTNLNVAMNFDAQQDKSESSNTASPHGVQPFLGDSSVRPKVKQPKKDDTEIPKIKQVEGKDQCTVGTPRIETSEDDEDNSDDDGFEDVDIRYFYEELDLMIEEAEDNEDYDYLDILEGLKQNFFISDIIYLIYIYNEMDSARNSSLQSFRSEQKSDLVRESSQGRVMDSDQLLLTLNQMTASSTEVTSRQIGSVLDASSTKIPDVSNFPSIHATTTWQSRIRDYFKKQTLNRPLAGPLHPTQKATKLKDELCFACNGVYRWPRILHCFHKFCFPCVVKLYEKERNCLKCPICLRLTTQVNGPQSLIIDIGLAREMFEANMSPFCCTHCSSTEDAIKFCKDCLEYLCMVCYNPHNKSSAAIYHLFDNSDDKVGATSNGELVHMCSFHPGILMNKFCLPCRRPVCDNCSEDHNSHDVKELKDAIGDVRERDNINIAWIMELQNGCQMALKNLKQFNQFVDDQRREMIRNNIEYQEHLETRKHNAQRPK